jgi:polyisoprenoid-binding protein YceI
MGLKGLKFLGAVAICLIQFVGVAQYKLDAANSQMTIDGTSTIHDWTETVEQFNGAVNATVNGNQLTQISSSTLTIKVASIKSGKSGMDDNTYKALKSKKHPNITYKLASVNITGNTATLTGSLTIAGVTKTVKFKTNYTITNGVIKFTGAHTFNMTDFGIDPPTAVMGTIKTGDEVTVKFNLAYKK